MMKESIIFLFAVTLLGLSSSYKPAGQYGWYRVGNTDFSGLTDQGICPINGTVNCTVSDDDAVTHVPVYDTSTNIGDPVHILRFNP